MYYMLVQWNCTIVADISIGACVRVYVQYMYFKWLECVCLHFWNYVACPFSDHGCLIEMLWMYMYMYVQYWVLCVCDSTLLCPHSHLATPSGAYLTYPPTQFVSNFRPHNTPWYTSAEAHPSLLTLTPPEVGLREGSRLTVSASYAVRTPVSERYMYRMVVYDCILM